jgi:hypothetical protein
MVINAILLINSKAKTNHIKIFYSYIAPNIGINNINYNK